MNYIHIFGIVSVCIGFLAIFSIIVLYVYNLIMGVSFCLKRKTDIVHLSNDEYVVRVGTLFGWRYIGMKSPGYNPVFPCVFESWRDYFTVFLGRACVFAHLEDAEWFVAEINKQVGCRYWYLPRGE